MRVIFVALVSAIAAVGCEKDPAATESAKALTPAADSRATALPANAPKTIDVEGTVVRQGKAADNDAVDNDAVDDEGLGEPMDDVDDPESASDKSGVDKAGAPNRPAKPGNDAPKGDQVDEEE